MRQKIKKIGTSKAFFAVVSIILAILLWLYVSEVENNVIEHQVTGIEVDYIGENDILSDRQLLVRDRYEQTVSLTLSCRRSVASKLDRDSITISVDLTDILSEGVYEKSYNISYPGTITEGDVLVVGSNIKSVRVTIDRKIRRQVELRGKNECTVEEGYIMGEMEIAPNFVTVSGPGEIVNEIEYAEVTLKRENLNKTLTQQQTPFILYDKNGDVIETGELEADREMVSVALPVMMLKEVFFKLSVIEGGGAKEADTEIKYQPESVWLSGDPAILETLNSINLGSVRLDSFADVYEQKFVVNSIPNELKNESGVSEVSVSIKVNLDTKRLVVSDFELINVPAGYSAVILTQSLTLTLRGRSDEISKVQPHNIRAVCDLSVLSDLSDPKGRRVLTPAFYVDGFENVGIIFSDSFEKVAVSVAEIVDEVVP